MGKVEATSNLRHMTRTNGGNSLHPNQAIDGTDDDELNFGFSLHFSKG